MSGRAERGAADAVQVLDAEGSVREDATVPDLSGETLVDMYRDMVLARHADERAVTLQRQGRMGTYPPLAGQEGAQVGSAYAVADTDWVFPSYREHAVAFVRGQPISALFRYWMGDTAAGRPGAENTFTVSVPIATQLPHATGAAMAADLRGDDVAVLTYFGDGATSEGDFHEALNFAGVFDAPAVFFCNNNQWAISVPRRRQTASETLAVKAEAYGFDGVVVYGMDPLAVYAVTREAVERARDPDEGETRPTLIEAVQYRYGAHTTADDPSRYRDDAEVERWRRRDPLRRMEAFLRSRGLLDDERVAAIRSAVAEEVAAAVQAAEESAPPAPDELFAAVYATLPARLRDQRAELQRLRESYGDDAFL
ncbi:MAG: pyruvate dehydrogenase (acetyl-transferring) E1 component subunit alpha [Halobacteriaceae archaeon]